MRVFRKGVCCARGEVYGKMRVFKTRIEGGGKVKI